ncbi:MAG: hypothetical protein OEY24_08680 [Candidatus Bathyarchaeota archaeon]|nr:hypothetical protein [Candidatus Bathyarchaeota archaeon]MDH5495757.1 hypothetical protein [Candidatus Bathyarchaeota archaeon]
MGRSRTIPLARGLIAGETTPIYGQLEVSITNNSDIKIVIRRKPYTGRSDVKFSISSTSLQRLIDILQESKEKLDDIWLSRVATRELRAKKKISVH